MKSIHSIIIGIDTHKATHVAVAIDTHGTRLATLSIPSNSKGYSELERWARSLGEFLTFGIEGFVEYYNNQRYHESLNNVRPADVYFGRDKAILRERLKIKDLIIRQRRLEHQSKLHNGALKQSSGPQKQNALMSHYI